MAVLRKSSLLHLDSKYIQKIRSLRIQVLILKLNSSLDLESFLFFNIVGSVITWMWIIGLFWGCQTPLVSQGFKRNCFVKDKTQIYVRGLTRCPFLSISNSHSSTCYTNSFRFQFHPLLPSEKKKNLKEQNVLVIKWNA